MAARLIEVQWTEHFYYDESSPTCLRWNRDVFRGRHPYKFKTKGDVAGNTGKGNCFIWLYGVPYLAHRVIWEMHNGSITDSELVIDHIDGNGKNNVISNLRLVTNKVNAQNSKLHAHNSSGTCGVSYRELENEHGTTYYYWVANWKENGKYKRRSFSILKYGDDLARTLAEKARAEAIARMNACGESYTVRHGL
jgi:hypothetical protein